MRTYFRRLTGHRRDQEANRHLGYSLAFIAGAMNAGGFLAIGKYTSHMTGMVSGIADHLALGELALVLAGLASLAAFVLGAITTAILNNWARRRHLRSQYAMILMLEAALLLVFGIAGAFLATLHDLLAPVTILLLCYIMGLQNAIITKISGAEIRTTHITGITTDIGIEIGKMLYLSHKPDAPPVTANRPKLALHLRLFGSFLAGGIIGAISFKHIGYSATIPLAIWLLILAALPVFDDLKLQWWLYRHHRHE
ncbi:YoaK family protein [Chitinilyticum aquatile]|uniref:YoaK family protein n=1 Tax=Chitinilyticum aquatile TaxID=362520 RepID=UPI0004242FD0|nr:YoaK family protein [Chitinilyticum aquatile]